MEVLYAVIGAIAGIVLGIIIGIILRKKIAEKQIGSAEEQAKRLLEDAIKAAVITEDRVINNSALTLYMEIGGVKMTLAPWSAYIVETGEVVSIEPSAAPTPSIPDEIEKTPDEWLPGYVAPPVDPNPGEDEEPDEPIIPDIPTPPADEEEDDDEAENDDDFIDNGGWAPVGGK